MRKESIELHPILENNNEGLGKRPNEVLVIAKLDELVYEERLETFLSAQI